MKARRWLLPVRAELTALLRGAGVLPHQVYAVPIVGETTRVNRQVCGRCPTSATRFTKVRAGAGDLLVPLCDECHNELARQATRSLAVVIASVLLGTTVALTLPLLWTAGRLGELSAVVAGCSTMPFLLDLLARHRVPEGAACYGAPVTASDEWLCERQEFAHELASVTGHQPVPRRIRTRPWPPWVLVAAAPALLAWVALYSQRPIMRIVNLSGEALEIQVDGVSVVRLEPTSSESPNAGADLRIAVGERHLRAFNHAGAVVTDSHESVLSGRQHLYAPAAEEYCFWLEQHAYGRGGFRDVQVVPLARTTGFWALPAEIDTWFSSNPIAVQPDNRSSGGVLTALRQARCEDRRAGGEQ